MSTLTQTCAEHGDLCLYGGDEPEQCPWCHSSWTVIIRSGWHSCERLESYDKSERHVRVERARQLRQEAQEAGDGSNSARGYVTPTVTLVALSSLGGVR